MRKPGFLFLELYTQHIADYVRFFERVANFTVIRNEGDFVLLQSDCGEILLNGCRDLGSQHPFTQKLTGSGQGIGVEIGIVLDDLASAHAAAMEFSELSGAGAGWSVTKIFKQPWDASDFRVTTPDGYYLRFTT